VCQHTHRGAFRLDVEELARQLAASQGTTPDPPSGQVCPELPVRKPDPHDTAGRTFRARRRTCEVAAGAEQVEIELAPRGTSVPPGAALVDGLELRRRHGLTVAPDETAVTTHAFVALRQR